MAVFRPHLLETRNSEDKTPLMQAIENGDLGMVVFLVNNMGANVNTATMYTQRSPLMLAIFKGELEIAQFLCDKSANADICDINGLNVLHYAIDSNLLENVVFALKHVSKVDKKDSNGWSALMRGGK